VPAPPRTSATARKSESTRWIMCIAGVLEQTLTTTAINDP
jgi:hypothetical protein